MSVFVLFIFPLASRKDAAVLFWRYWLSVNGRGRSLIGWSEDYLLDVNMGRARGAIENRVGDIICSEGSYPFVRFARAFPISVKTNNTELRLDESGINRAHTNRRAA